ncbi:MAG: hypothetical protein ACR2MK_01325 [Solirubrobacteraceae bacterium]
MGSSEAMAQANVEPNDPQPLRASPLPPVAPITELAVSGGERYRVRGEVKEIERLIVDASRGSMMALAWLVEADTGAGIGINPEHVVSLRAPSS